MTRQHQHPWLHVENFSRQTEGQSVLVAGLYFAKIKMHDIGYPSITNGIAS